MTHTAKHTPGPWTVQEHPGNTFIWPGEPSENGPPLIASVNAWDKNCAANAALIAAAPAMYEAIRKVIEHRAEEYLDNTVEPYCSLVAALAQAEARS